MNDNKTCNSAPCDCKNANKSIACTVTQCANHCKSENYCSLGTVRIGTHEANPTEEKCVDCESFILKN